MIFSAQLHAVFETVAAFLNHRFKRCHKRCAYFGLFLLFYRCTIPNHIIYRLPP